MKAMRTLIILLLGFTLNAAPAQFAFAESNFAKYEKSPHSKDCLQCHASKQNHQPVTLEGDPVTRDKIPALCAQCHGKIFREWKERIHGKVHAKENSIEKGRQLNCTECHEPHLPRFKPMKASAAPTKKSPREQR